MRGGDDGGWMVPENEIRLRFMASGGPGGQHANRANTKVEAVWRPAESATVPAVLRDRIVDRFGHAVRVTVDDERSQLRNRELAIERLRRRVRHATVDERPRRATTASRASKRRRVDAKRRRGEVKRGRRRPGTDD